MSESKPQAIPAAMAAADEQSRPLVKVRLVPVQVFGTDECDVCAAPAGYGLMDAVSAWSDCNRAIGRIYRRDDPEFSRQPGDVITVYVPESEMWKFDKQFGDG